MKRPAGWHLIGNLLQIPILITTFAKCQIYNDL